MLLECHKCSCFHGRSNCCQRSAFRGWDGFFIIYLWGAQADKINDINENWLAGKWTLVPCLQHAFKYKPDFPIRNHFMLGARSYIDLTTNLSKREAIPGVHPSYPRRHLTVPQFQVPASCSSDASSPGAAMRFVVSLHKALDGDNKMQQQTTSRTQLIMGFEWFWFHPHIPMVQGCLVATLSMFVEYRSPHTQAD